MSERHYVDSLKLYEFLNPKLKVEDWNEKISKRNCLIGDSGILLVDMVVATEIMEQFRRNEL